VSPSRTHLALVGLMGAGKSTVGRLVAPALGLPFVDVDVAIAARTGSDVRELWRTGGERAYRPLERAVVLDALAPTTPTVLAVPAGAIDDAEAAAALDRPHVAVVYLWTDPSVLAARVVAQGQPRPLLGSDPERVLAAQAGHRDARYRAIADLVVEEGDDPPELIAAAVLAAGLVAGAEPVA
jgi:shikimate kinase